jgi:uncharacterized protein (TIGR02284 family)
MTNDKTVDALNRLVEINNDRIEGYETATDETNEQDLKALFEKFAQNSHTCREELATEIVSLDGTATEGTKTSGKLFRVWMDVKAALTGEDRHAILSSCEFGEDQALQTYRDVLKDDREHLSASQIDMITKQMSLLKGDHDKVKAMRDAVKVQA